MDGSCLNCGKLVEENYCGGCGQKKYERIDQKYIINELEHTIFQTNKGFLYSIKNIIKNPGKTAREFIDGSRVNHYKPILLAFLLSGISAFISFKIIGLKEVMELYYSKQNMNSQLMTDIWSFTSSYNSIIMLLFIPFLALVTKLAFRKWEQNYYEHIVMNAYILSFYTIINIVILHPIFYFLKSDVDLIIHLSSLSLLILPLIMVWFFKGFYVKKSFKSIASRILLTILLVFFGFISMSITAGFVFALILGPEAIEYFEPK